MSEALVKPCPCCGDSAEIAHPYYPAQDAVVECQTCYLRTSDEATDQEAIDTWNRRDPLAAALARVSRLEEAARKVKQMIDADPDISVGKARTIGRLIDVALEVGK